MSDNKQSGEFGVCSKCGVALTSDSVDDICVQCQVTGVEDKIPAPKPVANETPSSLAKIWFYARWMVIVVCLGACVYFFMNAREVFAAEKPIRNGSYNTDATTDTCIRNLWKAAALLQSKKEIPKTLICPACKKAYIVIKEGDVTTVSCPDPAKHGCSALVVNSKTIVPEVIK